MLTRRLDHPWQRRAWIIVLSAVAAALLHLAAWECRRGDAAWVAGWSSVRPGTVHCPAQDRRRCRLSAVKNAAGSDQNPFDVLDLAQSEAREMSGEEFEQAVKAAFRQMARKYHPDVPDTGDAEKFQELGWAVEELSTAEGRKRWQISFARASSSGSSSTSSTGAAGSSYADYAAGTARYDFDVEDLIEDDETPEQRRKRERLERIWQRLRRPKAKSKPPTMLSRVQKVLAAHLRMPVEEVRPNAVLRTMGMGQEDRAGVRKVVTALEEEFGFSLTMKDRRLGWVWFELPEEVVTVADLKDFIFKKGTGGTGRR
eukprot:TRINITY_DN42976_c0_g1_i1.p1 TRINITY_DN42976_c0_g1~~TRINITY_DN42976_c0_g1_i1.p1  ORF type:complete len:314 (+),score=70.50 TRINITY_DN42976_c0_g1_i1:35-976(+)